MTTSPYPSVTDELIAELDDIASGEDGDDIEVQGIRVGFVRSILAERAEFKRDAERYRLFAETVAAEFAGETLTGSHKALFDAMNSQEEIFCVGDVDAMFDAAMEAEDE